MTKTDYTFTKAQVLETLEAIVAEDPDKVALCYYTKQYAEGISPQTVPTEEVQPECIVGQFVFKAFGAKVLQSLSTRPVISYVRTDLVTGEAEIHHSGNSDFLLGAGVDPEGLLLLSAAQGEQDLGKTWKTALADAKITADLESEKLK